MRCIAHVNNLCERVAPKGRSGVDTAVVAMLREAGRQASCDLGGRRSLSPSQTRCRVKPVLSDIRALPDQAGAGFDALVNLRVIATVALSQFLHSFDRDWATGRERPNSVHNDATLTDLLSRTIR